MKKVLINTGSNASLLIIKITITFIMTPVLVHNLGEYDYGIWEIIAAVLGYMGMLDFGLRPTISRFSAKYHAEKLQEELQTLYSTSWVFMGFVGFVLFLVFIGWALLWPELLSANGEPESKYINLLVIIGVRLLFTFPGLVAESFLEGFQKYRLKNNITIVSSIIGATIVYTNINPLNAIVVLVYVNSIMLTIKYLLYSFLMRQSEFGGLRPSIAKASWQCFIKIAGFGSKSFVQGIASRIEIGTDTIVIGYFLGPAVVLFYAIPANLISYVRNMGWTLTDAFMPLFSEMHAKDMRGGIRQLYLNASRYVVALLLPTGAGITLVGPDFIGLWVGEQYQRDTGAIVLLLVIYMVIPFLNPFSSRYLTAIGKHGLLAKISPISACVNLIMSIILVQYWGIIGVAIGSVIPVFIMMPIVLKSCCGFLGITVIRYLAYSVLPAIMPTIAMWCAVYLFRQHYPFDNYTAIFFAVFIGGMIFCIYYYILSFKQNERQWLKSQSNRVLSGLRRLYHPRDNYKVIVFVVITGVMIYCIFNMELNESQWLKSQFNRVLLGLRGY